MSLKPIRLHMPAAAAGRMLLALLAAGALTRPAVSHAQSIGPTPQPPGTPVTPEQAGEAPEEWYAYHFQSTFTEQFNFAYHAAFTGAHSLPNSANGRETFDATAYLGVRPWSGAELWWNPEVDQGFGLGNTFGVAGYLSGEAYKVGAQDPYLLQQRLFLRQTINLGGENQRLDADLNQLAGTQTANRIVLTAGKFSVVDIFDNNTYAHDPRGDFLNWSVIDGGAFDYAAQAWGFTYGAAAELYLAPFAARIGAFNLSNTPNGNNIDPRILNQFQVPIELEEDHKIFDQPGKVRVLFWFDRGELGSYSDAIANGLATGTTPSTGAVRSYKTKVGYELNIEQQIIADLGYFFRASWMQGNVEEDTFTDIQRSIQMGLAATGTRWDRPKDTVGLAVVYNGISKDFKQYLQAGGLGGIIGDGALVNSGPEEILETFYNVALYKDYLHLTADYQFVNNPAFNADRGPVHVVALRLHAEF